MRFLRSGLLGAALVASFALVACGSDDDEPTPKIFVTPPWDGAETLTYNLEQQGVDNEATCVLKTDPEPGGSTTLSRLCSDNRGNKDDGVAVVESETLLPIESTRTTFDAEENRTTVHRVVYDETEARFETKSGDQTRDTTRDLPEPTAGTPDPGWYDDESLLWLVRGIKLEDGYEASYTHVINAGQPRILPVEVKVEGTETIDVPAGQFTAWKVRVSRDNSVYTFWIDEAQTHPMVKARIEDSTYELSSID